MNKKQIKKTLKRGFKSGVKFIAPVVDETYYPLSGWDKFEIRFGNGNHISLVVKQENRK